MKNVLVFFANSSPGREIYIEFLLHGYRVVGVDLNSNFRDEHSSVLYYDDFGVHTIKDILHKYEFDYIIYPYCRFFYQSNIETADKNYYEINYRIAVDLVRTLPYMTKLVYLSDFSVYPILEPMKHENSQMFPIDYYGLTKALGEAVVSAAEKYVIVRPGFIVPNFKDKDKLEDFCSFQIQRFYLPDTNYSIVRANYLAEKIRILLEKYCSGTINVCENKVLRWSSGNQGMILNCSRLYAFLGKTW